MLLGAEYLPEETIEKIGSATIYEKNNKLFIRIKWAYDGIPNKKCGISPNSPSHCIGDIVDKESIYLEHYINEMGKKLILATYRALE